MPVLGPRRRSRVEQVKVATRGGRAGGGLFVWLSGADADVLAKCPRERRKFVGVGGAVLTTATLGALSATFALASGVRAPLPIAVLIGIAWGLAILNLDRWLVGATQRRDRWYQNLALAVPRLLLALVIGAVVSTPLVLWIFQAEIQNELGLMQQTQLDEFQKKLATDERFKEIPKLRDEVRRLQGLATGATPVTGNTDPTVTRLRAEYEGLLARHQKAQDEATRERDGQGGTGRQGDGPVYRMKQGIADGLKTQRDAAKRRLDEAISRAESAASSTAEQERERAAEQLPAVQRQLDTRLGEKALEESRVAARTRDNQGLLAQMEALRHFTSQNPTLRMAYLALLVFITAIEILPVLVKFLMSLGPPTLYDRVLKEAEAHDIDTAKAAFAHERLLAQREVEVRGERETALVERMVAADVDVRGKAIDQWRSAQLHRADIDPTTIVRQQRIRPVRASDRLRALLRDRVTIPRRRPARTGATYAAWPAAEDHDGWGQTNGEVLTDPEEGDTRRWHYRA